MRPYILADMKWSRRRKATFWWMEYLFEIGGAGKGFSIAK